MSFLFVDHIHKIGQDFVAGDFSLDSSSKYLDTEGFVLSGIISEAVGQLASWKAIHDGNYEGRPIFLFADRIEILHRVPANTKIELKAEIHQIDSETICFSGGAYTDCRKVLAIDNCTGYFMKLSELEDPQLTRLRYQQLLSEAGLASKPSDENSLLSEIGNYVALDTTPTSIAARCCLAETCSFYRDHFPLFPVTPIVVINELVASICSEMLSDEGPKKIELQEVTRLKIREFIRPDETLNIEAIVKEKICINHSHEQAQVMVKITKDNKNILRGQYLFSVKNSCGG